MSDGTGSLCGCSSDICERYEGTHQVRDVLAMLATLAMQGGKIVGLINSVSVARLLSGQPSRVSRSVSNFARPPFVLSNTCKTDVQSVPWRVCVVACQSCLWHVCAAACCVEGGRGEVVVIVGREAARA